MNQTPSRRPTTILGKQSSPRTTSIFASSVRTITNKAEVGGLINNVERNGRKTLTTVQGLPKKFDQKKILKVIKKKFGTSEAAHTRGRDRRLTHSSLQWNDRFRH